MLPKSQRGLKNTNFRSLYRAGRRTETKFFRVCLARSNSEPPQFGVVVSNKISKSSVVRNRLRRTIYGQIEKFNDRIDKAKGKNFIMAIVVKNPAVAATSEEIAQDLEKVLKSYEIIK